jgi:hypothetical protein
MAPDDLAVLHNIVCDIEQRMLSQLDWWKDNLHSEDAETREHAERKVLELCEWLFAPPRQETAEERQRRIQGSLIAGGMAETMAWAIAKRGSKVTGRPVGAPRTTGPPAIRALTLRLTTDTSHRDIALAMIGGKCEHICPACNDTIRTLAACSGIRKRKPKARCPACKSTVRPQSSKEQVCSRCSDALRQSTQRLKRFLEQEGLLPGLPRRAELDRLSPEELARLFQPHD